MENEQCIAIIAAILANRLGPLPKLTSKTIDILVEDAQYIFIAAKDKEADRIMPPLK